MRRAMCRVAAAVQPPARAPGAAPRKAPQAWMTTTRHRRAKRPQPSVNVRIGRGVLAAGALRVAAEVADESDRCRDGRCNTSPHRFAERLDRTLGAYAGSTVSCVGGVGTRGVAPRNTRDDGSLASAGAHGLQ